MIKITQKGDFKKATSYLDKLKDAIQLSSFDKYGQAGVNALSSATPVDSGKTANPRHTNIDRTKTTISITFYNSNVNEGVPIAIILQYGHGTGTGGWAEGTDYINPAIQPIFDKMAEEAWKEVTNV